MSSKNSKISDPHRLLLNLSHKINIALSNLTFKIKTGYYIELLTPGTMKILGSTESKITKDENSEK